MDRELCFRIERKDLYLEQVLVDYLEIPVFFLCRGEQQYYVALCTDMDELSYIVVPMPSSAVYNLLHGKVPMRDVILKQKMYWNVVSGEEITMDIVTEHITEELDDSVLPEENACFKVLTEEMEDFVRNFDNEYFSHEAYCQSTQEAGWQEVLTDITFDTLDFSIDIFEMRIAQEVCQVGEQVIEVVLEEKRVKIPDYVQVKSREWSDDEALDLAA